MDAMKLRGIHQHSHVWTRRHEETTRYHPTGRRSPPRPESTERLRKFYQCCQHLDGWERGVKIENTNIYMVGREVVKVENIKILVDEREGVKCCKSTISLERRN